MKIKIRLATNKDIDAISELNAEALSYIKWSYDKRHIRNTLRSGYYYVAVDKDKVVGTLKLYIEHDWIWINTISISKDYRRQGIGSKLLKWAIKLGRSYGFSKVVLYTDIHAKRNQKFYEKIGFIEVEREKERKHMWVKLEKSIH